VLLLQVAVTTNITDLGEFLQHIITHTNMTCLNAADDALVGSSVHSSLYTVASLTVLLWPLCVSTEPGGV
jgi:hypothetical protein